jgi:hypothetical protein
LAYLLWSVLKQKTTVHQSITYYQSPDWRFIWRTYWRIDWRNIDDAAVFGQHQGRSRRIKLRRQPAGAAPRLTAIPGLGRTDIG